ncbi:uncharacterized protein EDB91DRAFT_1346294 [Suillus paluster]|uniref:uncharacterized protein n=1 Tax=Suillus paluster TaxID=48578 RepID=UPI001B883842|nr:uncharacterized protein EDB91DRAFT_1346294 [Suillus paluster]KAG1743197.1 hypothetical protein EDB91DRAFT_1346294 [Suillus paluster]
MTEINVGQDLIDTRQTIYVGIAGFTILVWDHLITSANEIELIWQGPKGINGYLFLLNRYLTPLGFIVNLVAYNLPTWGYTSCGHFVRYEGAMTAIGIEIAGVMMLLRVYAMYKYQRAAIAVAVFLLLAWIVVTAWLVYHGQPVYHPSNVHSCTMVFESGKIASASAWLPLLYDTYVFGLTLYRTLPSIRYKEAGYIVRSLFADGLLYYSVICTINLILTIMLIRAPEGVQNIAVQLELCLTVTMMSRITLHIKKQAFHGPSPHHSQIDSIIMSTRNAIPTPSGGVVIPSRLRSHYVSSARASSTRVRSGSAIVPPVRTITFAENPSLYTTRPYLNTIFSAANTPSGSLVSEHADWPVSNFDHQKTADIV